MNLTDFEQTPVHRVFELVKREAARYGVIPVSSEIVGLIPKKALEQAAEWFLQVENFDSSLILENRLAAVMSGKMAVGGLRAGVEPFVEQLAAPTARQAEEARQLQRERWRRVWRDGGGMSRGKKAYLQHMEVLSSQYARLALLKEELKSGIDADAEAFHGVMAAFKAAKDSADGESRMTQATKLATQVPLDTAKRAKEVERILEALKPITNRNMASDLTTGIALAQAAITGALANVEINLAGLKDEEFVTDVKKQVADLHR